MAELTVYQISTCCYNTVHTPRRYASSRFITHHGSCQAQCSQAATCRSADCCSTASSCCSSCSASTASTASITACTVG